MKKALFIGWYPNPADKYKNVFFQNLVYEIARQGVDCTVISPVSVMKYRQRIREIPDFVEDRVDEKVVVHTYYPKTFSTSSIQIGSFNTEVISERLFEEAAVRCAKKLNQKFDFVYGHFFLYGGLAATRVARKLNIPAFIAYGECDFDSQVMQTYGIPKSKELQGLAGIIAVSSKNKKELDDLGFVKDIPMIVAPNSTDMSLFFPRDKAKCREQLGLPQDRFIVGFVGGFIERKGDKRLLAAANQVDDVYLAFAGRGEPKPEGDRVVFCDALDHDDVPVLLNAVDVFCLPTLSEGSCNAIVEAMACGNAIVSSDLAFNDDALNEENSIRIDPNSVDEIRDAIAKLKNDPSLLQTLKNKALEDSKEFDIHRRTTKILDFIQQNSV